MDLAKIIKGFIHVYRQTTVGATATPQEIEKIVRKYVYKLLVETNIGDCLKQRLGFSCFIKNISDTDDPHCPYAQAISNVFYDIVVCGQTVDSDFSYVVNNLSYDEIGAVGLMMEYSK